MIDLNDVRFGVRCIIANNLTIDKFDMTNDGNLIADEPIIHCEHDCVGRGLLSTFDF
jgi:hypothetical protein